MKKGWLVGLLAAGLMLMGGCAAKDTPARPAAEVLAAVEAGQAFEELTPLDAEQIQAYLDVDAQTLADAAMAMDASRATAQCIVVLTAKDAQGLAEAEAALGAYRDATLAQYRDYRPEEVPGLEGAVRKTHGLQTVLVVSPDAGAAEAALAGAWK